MMGYYSQIKINLCRNINLMWVFHFFNQDKNLPKKMILSNEKKDYFIDWCKYSKLSFSEKKRREKKSVKPRGYIKLNKKEK